SSPTVMAAASPMLSNLFVLRFINFPPLIIICQNASAFGIRIISAFHSADCKSFYEIFLEVRIRQKNRKNHQYSKSHTATVCRRICCHLCIFQRICRRLFHKFQTVLHTPQQCLYRIFFLIHDVEHSQEPVVPVCDHRKHTDRRDTRFGKRKHNPEKGLEFTGSVHSRGFYQLNRYTLVERPEHHDVKCVERHREDQRPHAVAKAEQLCIHHICRNDTSVKQHRKEHQERKQSVV